MSNKKKTIQLGMPYGTANNRLKKSILFDLIQRSGLDVCYRCSDKIDNEKDLSIEHKISWLDSKDHQKLFFDLDNISFSHLSCNCRASTGGYKKKYSNEEKLKKKAIEKRELRLRRKIENPELVKNKRRERYLKTGN